MGDLMKIDSIQDHCDYFRVEPLHPLVNVIEGQKANLVHYCPKLYGIYTIILKDLNCGTLKYGRSKYDYQEGTLLFIAPSQVMGSEDDGQLHQPEGWILTFHPEFLRGTALVNILKDYTYFSYNANEALHISQEERETVIGCLRMIQTELQMPMDKHGRKIVIDSIRLFLDYCNRIYDRQFESRETVNKDILSKFETLLTDYFNSEQPILNGLPTVQYCADKLCLSSNYFSDLVKKETGQSALKHIQQRILNIAKERVYSSKKSISEISEDLGFPYPQHFTRWFKKMEGCTPNEYRRAMR